MFFRMMFIQLLLHVANSCDKYIYLYKELVTCKINMNEQCIYYIYVLIFVNVG